MMTSVMLDNGEFNYRLLYLDLPHLRQYDEDLVRQVAGRLFTLYNVKLIASELPEMQFDDVKAIASNRWVKSYRQNIKRTERSELFKKSRDYANEALDDLREIARDIDIPIDQRLDARKILFGYNKYLANDEYRYEALVEVQEEIEVLKATHETADTGHSEDRIEGLEANIRKQA